MDDKMVQLLQNFHVTANKGSLHSLDQERLFDFIQYAARSPYSVDDVINTTFQYLTNAENKPWREDLAREIIRDLRFGIELLQYADEHNN